VRGAAAAFLAGVVALHALPVVPAPGAARVLGPVLLALPLLALLLHRAVRGRRSLRLPAIAVAGFLWALGSAAGILARDLPPAHEGRDRVVEGVVASLPERVGRALRFELDTAGGPDAALGRLRLAWYGGSPALAAGERWRLRVRLKRARGFANPGGFDYEGWLFRRRIRVTGYVRAGPESQRVAAAGPGLAAARQHLAGAIGRALAGHPHRGEVEALALGVRARIPPERWDVLRGTGTAHLMAISGLHVGLVAGLAFALGRALWALAARPAAWLPAARAGVVLALVAALAYAALAGFSVPTRRALVMVAALASGTLLGRSVAGADALAVALAAVLVLDPHAVMASGFWLSFAAVALIFAGLGARPRARGPWWRLGRVHWVVGVGLLPLGVALFGAHPLLGPVANVLAVPWTGLVIVPLVLAGAATVTLAPAAGAVLLGLGADAVALGWPLLEGLARRDLMLRPPAAAPAWALAAACCGVLIALLPPATPGRWLAPLWLLPVFLLPVERPAPGAFHFTLLDVGQGLAAVVRTHRHALVYDAGPRYGPRLDAGRAVLVPYLRAAGVRAVDVLVLSHRHRDHTGGAPALRRLLPVAEVIGYAGAPGAARCAAGRRWHWDGVRFEVLYPAPAAARRPGAAGNDASCVLRVTAPGGALLLPGDVEASAEGALLAAARADLGADVLVAPHHGSATSSSAAWLDAVAPRDALFAVGHRNRFGFPDPQVVGRYRARGVRLFDTARDGALRYRFEPGRGVIGPLRERAVSRRFWRRGGS